MASQAEIERIALIVAERVKSRLGMDGPADDPSCGCEGEVCQVCGVNPAFEPGPGVRQPVAEPSQTEVAKWIDHTFLKPDATREQIETLCQEAKKHRFFSVCVNSSMVHLARSLLYGTDVKVCAVVGFPLGAGTPGAKAYEAREAIRCGADEIDMVINIGALKSRDYRLVEHDIERVVKASQPKILKVILETGMLEHEQKVIGCALSKAAGAHYVKTSTGFGPGGATVEDVALMRSVVGPDVGVKASGGVRDYATALEMIRAGASRLGCSSSVAIVTGGRGSGGY